jgi:RimJ/RimL family protein N-acetyltransferase/ketosteroid isomerase-like protein
MQAAAIPLDTVVKTARCTLRAPAEDDIPMIWSATRVPGFNDGMRWDPPASPDELVAITRRNRDEWAAGRVYSFTLVDPSGAPIGRVGLHGLSPDGTWGIGYWVHPDHWGRGYATEAAQAALDFAFAALHAKRVVLSHATWNHASRRVAEKLGMRLTGEIACGFEKHGKPVPELVWVLDAPANKRTVRRYMEAFAESDHAGVLACLTDDVEWVLPGGFHLRGKAQFDAEIVNPAFEPRPRIEVTRLVEEGDVVVAEGRVRATKKDGEVLDIVFCDVFEMRETKIRKLTSYLHILPKP